MLKDRSDEGGGGDRRPDSVTIFKERKVDEGIVSGSYH